MINHLGLNRDPNKLLISDLILEWANEQYILHSTGQSVLIKPIEATKTIYSDDQHTQIYFNSFQLPLATAEHPSNLILFPPELSID